MEIMCLTRRVMHIILCISMEIMLIYDCHSVDTVEDATASESQDPEVLNEKTCLFVQIKLDNLVTGWYNKRKSVEVRK